MKRPASAVEAMLWPAALLYQAGVWIRNLSFDRGWREETSVTARVLSVGNLTAGGTGKTPLTAHLLEGFRRRGRTAGIVSRGYGGRTRGPARVPADGSVETAFAFGDEPTWLANRFPNTPVYVGRSRVAAVHALLDDVDVDMIIADDAFQHRKLRRSLDVVILDATEPEWHYRALPLGRMREGFGALSRAHAIFISKTNLVSQERLAWLRLQIDQALVRFEILPYIYELESVISRCKELKTNEFRDVESFRGRKVVLVSGIGRPQAFADLIAKSTGCEIAEHIIFSDHHAYTASEFTDIEMRAKAVGADCVILTEKDAVKATSWNPAIPVWVSQLEMRSRSDLGELYEAFDRAIF